jgi:hypothetical protein
MSRGAFFDSYNGFLSVSSMWINFEISILKFHSYSICSGRGGCYTVGFLTFTLLARFVEVELVVKIISPVIAD